MPRAFARRAGIERFLDVLPRMHLGMRAPGRGWSKRKQPCRVEQGAVIATWIDARGHGATRELRETLRDGFGPEASGEDAFDATVGLCSMLDVALGARPAGAPADPFIRGVEGWILGQAT